MGRLVLNHSTNIEGLIPVLQKLALNINIKTITPAVISRARGRSSKLIIRLSVKTINGYKAIARKGKTAQEVFISTDLSRDELKQIIDIYNEWVDLIRIKIYLRKKMKLLLNLFLFLFSFFLLGDKSFSITDYQIKKICKKEKREFTCIKNLQEKRSNLQKGKHIQIPVIPYKGN